MNISNITGGAGSDPRQQVNNPGTQLGKDDFLRLLTVQLRYQDPLNPLDNTEFIAQMAQFSSLEQLQNMNRSIEKNHGAEAELSTAFRHSLATSLVGKEVEVSTDEVSYDGKRASSLSYQLGAGARKATLSIIDGRGQLVREFDLDTATRAGSVAWDGRSGEGREVPKGAYRVVVAAENATGQLVEAKALARVRVEAVRYDGQEAHLRAGGRELKLEDLAGVLAGND